MASNRFTENHLIVPGAVSGGLDYNAGGDLDSVNMAKYNHLTLILIGDASVAGDGVLTMYGGLTDGSKTAACGFTYRYSSGNAGAASADVLGTAATVSAGSTLTITGASLASRMLIIEMDASDMVVSGTQYQYVTPSLSSAGTAGTCTGIFILSEPRYAEAVMPTAIPTT